jgi:uncharacterized glyoxalase superfamily protein PhnB
VKCPRDPGLICPDADCGEHLIVVESGWGRSPGVAGTRTGYRSLCARLSTNTSAVPVHHRRLAQARRRIGGTTVHGRALNSLDSAPLRNSGSIMTRRCLTRGRASPTWYDHVVLRACSHLVLASHDVPRITAFFADAFAATPRFANEVFSDFVLPSAFRIAFFKPVGPTAATFTTTTDRRTTSIGLTVDNVDEVHARVATLSVCSVSGPPRDHPWGERSFLLTDPDGNRWEVTQSPRFDGMLPDR